MAVSSPYQATAVSVANKYGIPPGLFEGLIGHESGWKPYAVGSAGEIGLGQVKPTTGEEVGIYNLYSPESNLEASARYLKKQFNKFGNWFDALRAYNRGPGDYTNPKGTTYANAVLANARNYGYDTTTQAQTGPGLNVTITPGDKKDGAPGNGGTDAQATGSAPDVGGVLKSILGAALGGADQPGDPTSAAGTALGGADQSGTPSSVDTFFSQILSASFWQGILIPVLVALAAIVLVVFGLMSFTKEATA